MLNATEKTKEARQASAPAQVNEIRPGVPVTCSAGVQIGVVDRVESPTLIKLAKDDKGVNHYIPMSWIARIEQNMIYANRPGAQIAREWTTEPPKA